MYTKECVWCVCGGGGGMVDDTCMVVCLRLNILDGAYSQLISANIAISVSNILKYYLC